MNTSKAHLTAVKRILRYLKGTVNLALKYQKSEKSEKGSLIGYSDADWGGDFDSRHTPTTGNLFLMAGSPISWLSKKQTVLALSTLEAEYITLCLATQEAVWIRKLLTELLVSVRPVMLMEDNQAAIAIARNPMAHARTKHIDIRFHYVREALQNGAIDVHYCPTSEMLADLLTKSLSKGQFETLRSAMGMDMFSV